MKKFVKYICAGSTALLLLTGTAHTQSLTNYQSAVSSLAATGKNARRMGVDTDAITRSIKANIAKGNPNNSPENSSALADLKRLPQLIVQVQFNLDSALIRPESWVTVGRIADALHHPLLDDDRFLIVGHTDASGTREHNLGLSDRRALSVASMLIDVYKVNPRRLMVLGLGEEQLRDRANPEGGINRRVELFNLGPV